ncbi:hypothetical protein [Viscerimonas tarda]
MRLDIDSEVTDFKKINETWIENLVKEGYNIYDIGNLHSLAGEGLTSNWRSVFYEMEKSVVFP